VTGDADRKHLYLVDGTSQLFRAYFAIRGLTNAEGVPTNAVYGFTSMLRKMIADEAPPFLAVAFDLDGPTFRHAKYSDYKSHRPAVPEDLLVQMPRAREVCEVLRIPVLELSGYEADDLIATVARLAQEQGFRTTVVAGDKDLLQLVRPGVDVLNPSKNLRLDEAGVAATFGVPPRSVRDVLGLMGDAVDNIPGVPGVGEKTALAMVSAYGSLDQVLERAQRFVAFFAARDRVLAALEAAPPETALAPLVDDLRASAGELIAVEADAAYRERLLEVRGLLDTLVPTAAAAEAAKQVGERRRRAAKALRELEKGTARKVWTATHEHAEAARMSRELATLDDQAPVAFEPDALRRTSPDPARARELFQSLGFRAFLAEVSQEQPPPSEAAQADATEAATLRTAAEVEALASAAQEAGSLAFSVAAEGSHPLRMRLVGFGFAIPGGARAKLVWTHAEGDGADEETRRAVAAVLADASIPKTTHDWKRALHALAGAGLELRGAQLDTRVGGFLLDPGRGSYALADVESELFGLPAVKAAQPMAASTGLFAPDATAKKMDEAADDAAVVARVQPELTQRLAGEGLLHLYQTVDGPLLPILARMERTGIRVDRGLLESMSGDMDVRLARSRERIVELAGTPFNPDSPKQLREVLFGTLGLKSLRRTTKSKVESTDADTLEELAEEHEIAREVLAYRELAKLKGTYVDALPVLIAAETGRVHTTYDPTGAATGRLSSFDPNLQNIPARTEAGRRIRAAFVPEPGYVFLASDYSQVELRILAHLTEDEELLAAFRSGEDIHRRTAARIFGIELDLVTAGMRQRAKAVNFGILYGMSETRLARDQGIPREEARRFIEAYFDRFQRIRAYIDDTRAAALREGRVRTLFGRVRRFPQLSARPGRAAVEQALRAAVNTTVQGTAADLMKMSMIVVDRSLRESGLGARMLLQVHDELLFEVPEKEVTATAALVRTSMEGVWPLAVPLAVDQKVGKDWLETT